MARTLSGGLPPSARLAIGVLTVAIFAFAGMTMLQSQPTVGWVLLALSVFRALQWLREVRWYLTPYEDEVEPPEEPPPR